MKTPDEIIEVLGGAARVREALNLTPSAIRKWRQFGAVPSRHHMALLRLGAGRLSLDDFHEQSSTEAA